MAVSKTGRKVQVGDWVYNTDGIYEVTAVDAGNGRLTYAREVYFSEEDTEAFTLGDEFMLTKREVRQMDIF